MEAQDEVEQLLAELLAMDEEATDSTRIAAMIAGEVVVDDYFRDIGETVMDTPLLACKILKASSDIRKVGELFQAFPKPVFKQCMKETCELLQKNFALARLLRERGDEFSASDSSKAIRCYNLATCFAPTKTKLLANIYAQRAEQLFKLEKKQDCLADIEMALNQNPNGKWKTRMLELQMKCLSLESRSEFIPNHTEVAEYRDNVIFDISKCQHPKIQSGADCIDIVSDPLLGRKVIFNKDVEPGTVIMVETPYVAALNDALNWDMSHCASCFKTIRRGIPCENCVFMIYCDEKCRSEHFDNGHNYECACMPFLHGMRLAPNIHMCFKILCKAGPKLLFDLYKKSTSRTTNSEPEGGIKGFDPETGKYDSDSYHQIFNLITHECSEGIRALSLIWTSVVFAYALDIKTDFFAGIKDSDKEGFFLFVAAKALHHQNSVCFNSFGLCESSEIEIPPTDDDPNPNPKFEKVEASTGLYSLISLMNHSCDPTVTRVNLQNGKMAIFTNRKMKALEEATGTYGYVFTIANHSLDIRGPLILKNYRFLCKCSACIYDWPTRQTMVIELTFICPSCRGSFDYFQTDIANMCTLVPGRSALGGLCRYCGQEFEIVEMRNEAWAFQDKLYNAQKLVNAYKMLEAVPLLIECISYYQTAMLMPNSNFLAAQEILRQCVHQIIEIETPSSTTSQSEVSGQL